MNEIVKQEILKQLERQGKLALLLLPEERDRIMAVYKKDIWQQDLDRKRLMITRLQAEVEGMEKLTSNDIIK